MMGIANLKVNNILIQAVRASNNASSLSADKFTYMNNQFEKKIIISEIRTLSLPNNWWLINEFCQELPGFLAEHQRNSLKVAKLRRVHPLLGHY
jgi:hypothetical protein